MPRLRLRKKIRALTAMARSFRVTPTSFDEQPARLHGPNRSYQKFVLIGHERSGTSFVIEALETHPHIVAFGELFLPYRIDFNIRGYNDRSIKSLDARNKYPIDFLEGCAFASYPDDTRAVGFKLFPDHMDNRRFTCLWQWLQESKDLKIISLSRQDLLATYTSLLIAKKDKRFSISDPAERSKTTVTIDPRKCAAEFRKRTDCNERIRQAIEGHEAMNLTYEELTLDPSAHIKAMQAFLGVDSRDLEITHAKHEVRPLRDVIENFDALRRHFSGTEWESFFAQHDRAAHQPAR